jgi:[acyl-carrier-protein] S-malonyltransferase
MGSALYEEFSAAREVFDAADRALGFSLSRLCFEGPAEELMLTSNTQPALLTTSVAALRAIQQAHRELEAPNCAAGHSLGEYSALVAAGALELEEAVRLAHQRGSAMQRAVPPGQGAMVAVIGGDAAAVQALCDAAREDDVLAPANFNSPGQIVIAGSTAACERARAVAKQRKLKAIPLRVSAPFHCALMAPAKAEFAPQLRGVSPGALRFPVVSNVTAEPNQDAGRIIDLLIDQIDGAVRWQQSVEWMAKSGVTHVLEIGPGKVLAGLIKSTAPGLSCLSVGDPVAISQIAEFLR